MLIIFFWVDYKFTVHLTIILDCSFTYKFSPDFKFYRNIVYVVVTLTFILGT